MAIKTDIKNVFHRVEWKFLLERMRHLGFPERRLHWISHIYREPLIRY